MFVLGSLWGRHLLVLTNPEVSTVGTLEEEVEGVKEWQWATGYDNGDIFGWRTGGVGWSVECVGWGD